MVLRDRHAKILMRFKLARTDFNLGLHCSKTKIVAILVICWIDHALPIRKSVDRFVVNGLWSAALHHHCAIFILRSRMSICASEPFAHVSVLVPSHIFKNGFETRFTYRFAHLIVRSLTISRPMRTPAIFNKWLCLVHPVPISPEVKLLITEPADSTRRLSILFPFSGRDASWWLLLAARVSLEGGRADGPIVA